MKSMNFQLNLFPFLQIYPTQVLHLTQELCLYYSFLHKILKFQVQLQLTGVSIEGFFVYEPNSSKVSHQHPIILVNIVPQDLTLRKMDIQNTLDFHGLLYIIYIYTVFIVSDILNIEILIKY